MTELAEDHKTYKIALLVSISCVLQISESLIPHPIPGLRLGLANMLTLVALVTLGLRSALEIAILRTILSGFIMGTFMSPTFILSFSAALASTLVMGFLFWLSGFRGRYRFSIVGISIFGALTHNMVQLYLAYLILVRHRGIFVFLPWLAVGAVVTGLITGMVSRSVCVRVNENQKRGGNTGRVHEDAYVPRPKHFTPGTSFLHRLAPETKILTLLILSLALLIFSSPWLYLGLFLFLLVVILFSGTSLGFLFSRIKKYCFLLFMGFSVPLFFSSGEHVLFDIAHFQITHEALSAGAIFSLRILFLILLSALLVRTTSAEEMTYGFARTLSVLRYLGISERRVAMMLTLSWTAMPFCWDAARRAIRTSDVSGAKTLRNFIPALSHLIAALYLAASPQSACWKNASTGQEKRFVPPGSEPE